MSFSPHCCSTVQQKNISQSWQDSRTKDNVIALCFSFRALDRISSSINITKSLKEKKFLFLILYYSLHSQSLAFCIDFHTLIFYLENSFSRFSEQPSQAYPPIILFKELICSSFRARRSQSTKNISQLPKRKPQVKNTRSSIWYETLCTCKLHGAQEPEMRPKI